MKRNISLGKWTLYWSITLFMVMYFSVAGANVGAVTQACVAGTNYMTAEGLAAYQRAQNKPVAVDQITITNLMPVVQDQTIISVNPSGDKGSPPESKVLAPLIFFIIIIAVFAWVIYQVIKMLDKVIPPPDPPPPPPSSPDTNRPPIVVNPQGGPGPAVVSAVHTKKLYPTPAQISTNVWAQINRYNISTNGWMDAFTTNKPTPYATYWSVSMQTSTNMVDWKSTHYRVDVYQSAFGAYLNYYHYGTNWYRCYFFAGTNGNATPIWFDLSDDEHRSDNQMFRLADPEPLVK